MTASTYNAGISVQQVYPAHHFFGISQELRDLVYENTFARGSGVKNSAALEPLLTCRRFYNEAHKIAWAHATFDTSISGSGFSILSPIPKSTVVPKLYRVIVHWSHLSIFYEHRKTLPRIETLRVDEPRYQISMCIAIVLQCANLYECVERFEVPQLVITLAMSEEGRKNLISLQSVNPTWKGAPMLETVDGPEGFARHYRLTIRRHDEATAEVNFFT